MEISTLFKNARRAIKSVITPEMPIGQAPIPAFAWSWAKKTIMVVVPHISQEKTWGLVVPVNIDRIYGINAMKVSKIAILLNKNLKPESIIEPIN